MRAQSACTPAGIGVESSSRTPLASWEATSSRSRAAHRVAHAWRTAYATVAIPVQLVSHMK